MAKAKACHWVSAYAPKKKPAPRGSGAGYQVGSILSGRKERRSTSEETGFTRIGLYRTLRQ